MPQWNNDEVAHVALASLFARFGITGLRMSMPYHDQRKPPYLERSDYMVSSFDNGLQLLPFLNVPADATEPCLGGMT